MDSAAWSPLGPETSRPSIRVMTSPRAIPARSAAVPHHAPDQHPGTFLEILEADPEERLVEDAQVRLVLVELRDAEGDRLGIGSRGR